MPEPVNASSTIYCARWMLQPTGEIIPNGAVAVEGSTIVDVSTRSKVKRSSGSRMVNLGDMLLLPGLINMHTHLEDGILRGLSREPEETFASWMAKKSTRLRQASLESIIPAVRLGIRESIAHGVTTIVDSSRTGASLVVLKDEPVRSWVVQEVHEEGDAQPDVARRMLDARKRIVADARALRLGLGPYAIFSVSPSAQRSLLDIARAEECLWATHMAESAEELQAFSEQKGDLYFQITRRRPWDYGRATMGPMHCAISGELIPNGAALFHCNYVNGHELSLLSAKDVAVTVCPRYNEELGHKRFPLDVALSRGITVCVGTESILEAGSAGIFDDLHCLRRQYPHIPARELLRWATQNPARVLRAAGRLGELSPGAMADIIGVSFAHDPSEDLLEELLVEDPSVRLVMVNGEEVVVDY
jgi:5-methylthioadenosine/S-adenosylhomocysteine deaminase